tara:strand:- start:41 stop:430 length:390 start_codon:yes stop_codon:yes gene_type:complete
MSQIYILTPTISEKRPINNRHKHITYPEANNTNIKFGINKPETVKELERRYRTHFKKDFKYKLIIEGNENELLRFENHLKENIFSKYINNFRKETNNSYTKEWMSGITFEDAEKIILEEYKNFSSSSKS